MTNATVDERLALAKRVAIAAWIAGAIVFSILDWIRPDEERKA